MSLATQLMKTKKQGSSPMKPLRYKVSEIWEETGDVYTMVLKPLEKKLKSSKPGQFNMLYRFGAGEVPISVSGVRSNGDIIHTIRDVGPVTHSLHRLKVGEEIGLRGPFGRGWPVEETHGKDVLIVAGGIGLAPLRPVIHSICRHRKRFGNVSLLYGARSTEDLLFEEEWLTWVMDHQIEMNASVDQALSSWDGQIGVVTPLIQDIPLSQNMIAMACGPEIMMRFVYLSLKKRGLSQKKVYLSLERNMKCAIGHCGHCQYRGYFMCKEGPVFRYDEINDLFLMREI